MTTVFDDMCQVGRWLFWSWFNVTNRSNFYKEDVRKENYFTFSFL